MNTAQRCWAVSIAVAGMLHFVHPAFGAPLPLQTESGGIAENLSSTNWAGYAAVAPANDHFTYVQAVWTVPTISASSPAFSFSSTWVGLDGFGSSTVEQIGTEADGAPGDSAAAQYYAWIELFPANPLVISNLTIHPGDTVGASVEYTGGNSFFFYMANFSTNIAVQGTLNTPSSVQRHSAEWIEEAPSSNSGVLPLADFQSVTFSQAYAQLASQAAVDPSTIYSVDTFNSLPLDLVPLSGFGARTGPLSSDGTTFTVDATIPEPASLGTLALAGIPLILRRARTPRATHR